MDKKAIRNTAIAYWSQEDECFVVASPLFERIAGVGETSEQAFNVFDNQLKDIYESYLEGKLAGYDKPGRPSTGKIPINTYVKPESRKNLKALGEQLSCTQGEIIDFLLQFYEHRKESIPVRPNKKSSSKDKSKQSPLRPDKPSLSDAQTGVDERTLNLLYDRINAKMDGAIKNVVNEAIQEMYKTKRPKHT